MTLDQERRDRFLALLEPTYDRLAAYIQVMVPDVEDARDLLGETILIGLERMDDVRDKESFMYYLFSIARRIHWKLQWRRRFFVPLLLRHDTLPISDPPPDMQVDIGKLNDAMASLPEKEKETAALYYIAGFTVAEIRSLQGGTASGVKSRLAAARRRLHALLADAHSVAPSALKNRHMNNREKP